MERIWNAFIYPIDLKGKARAFVRPCVEGYTIYVDINLPRDQQIEAALHELKHIEGNDFEKENVQEIERERHGESVQTRFRALGDPPDI